MTSNYSIQEMNSAQRPELAQFRRDIFVKEDKYPESEVWQPYDERARHFFILEGEKKIGVFSLFTQRPLPIEKYIDIDRYKGKHNAEIYKLAIAKSYRNTPALFFSFVRITEYFSDHDLDTAFIHSIKDKKKNITLYKKVGFKTIGEIEHPNKGPLTVLYCNFNILTLDKLIAQYQKKYKIT